MDIASDSQIYMDDFRTLWEHVQYEQFLQFTPLHGGRDLGIYAEPNDGNYTQYTSILFPLVFTKLPYAWAPFYLIENTFLSTFLPHWKYFLATCLLT
jgi:hypothetical protein